MNNRFNLSLSTAEKFTPGKTTSQVLCFLNRDEDVSAVLQSYGEMLNIYPDENIRKKLADENSKFTLTARSPETTFVTLQSYKADDSFSADYFRDYMAGFISGISGSPAGEACVLIPSFGPLAEKFGSAEYYLQTFAEGVHYGNYIFDAYKSDRKEPKNLSVTLVTELPEAGTVLKSAAVLMKSVAFTRTLQNEPASALSPQELAHRVREEMKDLPVSVTVFDEDEIAKRKMGGLLGVAQGSAHPPRFIIAEYNPAGAVKHIVIVGKGITFDTGGISIKPSANMGDMKGDMSGAAVAAGTVAAAAGLGLNIAVTAVIPSAENMPSGTAMRPGDILTTSSGLTIEVDNTDAEGRLILADALHYASQLKPDTIIDLATLTGACVVALGEFAAGLFTKNDALAHSLKQSSNLSRELIWRMPMWDEYNALIKSDVADVKNVGGKWGGAITAAKFLEKWTDKNIPWAHIDIAGPSGPHKYSSYTQPFFTGFGVRLLIQFLKNGA